METRRIDYIVVHCSATKEGKNYRAADIDRWHKERGYKKIGYHYVIDLEGKVEKGREESEIGAHVQGYNSNSIGICYIGGLDKEGKSKDTRTSEQKRSILKLLGELTLKYQYAQIKGHKDFKGVNKGCPCFDAKNEYKDI